MLDSADLVAHLGDGDAIMADRGLQISAELEERGVLVILPAFRGADRAQLTSKEVHSPQRIAEVRIHVERAIGKIKNFRIFNGDVPLLIKPIVGCIFTTCAYLTNFETPV